jgi:hypothetical protein
MRNSAPRVASGSAIFLRLKLPALVKPRHRGEVNNDNRTSRNVLSGSFVRNNFAVRIFWFLTLRREDKSGEAV